MKKIRSADALEETADEVIKYSSNLALVFSSIGILLLFSTVFVFLGRAYAAGITNVVLAGAFIGLGKLIKLGCILFVEESRAIFEVRERVRKMVELKSDSKALERDNYTARDELEC